MVDHVAGQKAPASSPSQADEALRRARPRPAPPLDVAQRIARGALAAADAIDWDRTTLSGLAAHVGGLQAALRMLADAVDTEVQGQGAA